MKTNVNIKVDTEVRDEAKDLFSKMGLDMTTAVNMFLLAAIREKGIPFNVTTVSSNEEESLKVFAAKLRTAAAQESAGQMRSFSDFVSELKLKYE